MARTTIGLYVLKDSARTLRWRSYLALCKPKVVLMIVFTTIVGMFLASPLEPPWPILAFAMLGIGGLAAAGAALNHCFDRRIDSIMARTRHRPLPRSEISTCRAGTFALILASMSMWILLTQVNSLTAWLTLASMAGYSVVYTLFLKYATPYNIVFGGAAGAMPPLLGWTAVSGRIELAAVVLFLIIFVWTPPHFWSLAIKRRKEYASAGVPMLPVTHGVAHTKQQVLVYTVALLFTSVLPYAIGMSGELYLLGALALGARFLWYAITLYQRDDTSQAGPTFRFSIFYIGMLFGLLLVDHYAGILASGTSPWLASAG